MKLFDEEFIAINRIYTVDKYVTKESDPKFVRYNNYFSTYELVFFLSGENETKVDNLMIRDISDSMRYMPKGQTAGAYTVHSICPAVCIDIYFDAAAPMPEHAIAFYDMEILRDKFLNLYNTWKGKKNGYYSKSMMIFYDIIHTIQCQNTEYVSGVQKQYMEKAYDYILCHYKTSDFDYQQLCAVSGLKYTQFNKLFKKTYHMTPVQLVTKMRIDHAKELLVTSHYRISEIAALCGFENPYYFTAVFKKQTGFSPSHYPLEG